MLVAENGKPGEVYNIGGGRELENLELTNLILREFKYGDEWIEFVPDRKGHDLRYSVDISKARDELGYEPKLSFTEGIKETIDWYRENRNWWEPLRV